jgi:hypothetical protein
VVAQIDYLLRVPLVAEDQGREEGQGRQHRERTRAALRQQDRAGGRSRREEDAECREEVAQPLLPPTVG